MQHVSTPPPLFFAMSESRALALAVCTEAGLTLAPLQERVYEGGEFKCRPLESVRDRTVFVLQNLAGNSEGSPADRLLRLLFLIRGLHDAGAARVIALTPYIAFARKDRRTQPRDPVTMRYVAELFEAASSSRIVALDVHNAAAFDNAFRIPTDHLTAIPLMVDHFARKHPKDELVVASPDIGGVKRAQIFRELLEARVQRPTDLVFLEKRRASGVVSGGTLVGHVEGRHVIMVDDLCATGGTLVRAAQVLRQAGAVAVSAAFTHAPVTSGLQVVIDAPAVSQVITTDSVGIGFHSAPHSERHKLKCLSIAPLFAAAVRRMIQGEPLAPLLSQWPL